MLLVCVCLAVISVVVWIAVDVVVVRFDVVAGIDVCVDVVSVEDVIVHDVVVCNVCVVVAVVVM